MPMRDKEVLGAHDARTSPRHPQDHFPAKHCAGDSRYPETTQFEMVQAFGFPGWAAGSSVSSLGQIDIVNVDFVAEAIATLHQKEQPQYDTYHLSSGRQSQTFRN